MPTFPFSPNMTPTQGPTWQQTTLHAETLADIENSAGPSTGEVAVYCEETQAVYKFRQGDTTARDGWVILQTNGQGVAGRWALSGDTLSIAPTPGDSWPRLFAALAAMAYRGTVNMRAGLWTCASKQTVPAGTRITASPGVLINSTLTPTPAPGGAEDATPFYNAGGNQLVSSTTANGAVAAGATSIVLTAAAGLSIGQNFFITNVATSRVAQFTAINIVGNTVTVDRPFLRPFSNLDPVTFITAAAACRDIVLEMGGATVSGSGDRAVEFILAQDCVVRDLIVAGGAGFDYFTIGLDVGSRDSGIERCSVDGMAHAGACFAVESANNCWIRECTGQRATWGIVIPESDGCQVVGGEMFNCGTGAILSVNAAADTLGCRECSILGGLYSNCSGVGIQISDGSRACSVVGASVVDCVTGISIAPGPSAAPPLGIRIADCHVLRGAQGITVISGTKHLLSGITTQDQTLHHVVVSGGNGDISGWSALDSTVAGTIAANSGMLLVATASRCAMTNCRIESEKTAAGNLFAIEIDGGAFVQARQTLVVRPGGAPATVGVYVNNGTFDSDDYAQTGGSNGVFLVGAASAYHEGIDVRWDATIVTPFFNAAAGPVNFGTVALTAAVPVAVAYTPIQAGWRVILNRIAVAGGTGLAPLVAITPATGFTLTGVALDTDTYSYKIVS